MTKTDLIDAVADMAGLTKVDAKKAVDAVADVVSSALSKGEKVTWTGFGTFEVRSRAARMGRNPQTGAPMRIPATKTPAFRSGKGLKDEVKE
ncbi:MAG TPA: HU family DNA-binding protein [candidate division WWE3 bacterium]|uniref:HU family DNA-binding protein n=1 Tax=candidate division WWE3 bacterium TaxID=2053526 RepID=A0A7C1DJW1_UNCKA|nr:HU family DNA-binding protein [candidate division WWE3 bacterium]